MMSLRTLLSAVVVAAGLTLLTPAPAVACSCVGGSVTSHADRAEVVLRGTLVTVEGPDRSGTWSSSDPVTYTFEVHEVFQGSSPSTTDIVSASDGASCGLERMREGREYVVFAAPGSGMTTDEDGQLGANLCGGTDVATPDLVEAVEQALGPGRAPGVDGGGAEDGAEDGAKDGARIADDPPARAAGGVLPTWAWAAGGGLTLALLAGVSALVARLRHT